MSKRRSRGEAWNEWANSHNPDELQRRVSGDGVQVYRRGESATKTVAANPPRRAPDVMRAEIRNRTTREVNSPGPRTNAPARPWFDAAGNEIPTRKRKKRS